MQQTSPPPFGCSLGLLRFFREIGHRTVRTMKRVLRCSEYTLADSAIIWREGWRKTERVEISQISFVRVVPEMVFDIVILHLKDGRELRWIDPYGELTRLLHRIGVTIDEQPDDDSLPPSSQEMGADGTS